MPTTRVLVSKISSFSTLAGKSVLAGSRLLNILIRRDTLSLNNEEARATAPEYQDWLANPGRELTAPVFSCLYDAFFSRVYNYFAYRTANRQEAEDLTAQVFERVIIHYRQFNPRRGSFESWLFAIARNALFNHSRSLQRHPQTVLDETLEDDTQIEPEQAVLRQEELLRLQRYIGLLSDRDRELLALHYGANLSQRQIGELLKMNENSVAVALGRALRRLRRQFEAEES